MQTIEKQMVTVATPEDIAVVGVIISHFHLFESHYGKFHKFRMGLNYKEFSTLQSDFESFYSDMTIHLGKFSVKELNSLKKSLMLLKENNQITDTALQVEFLNFLNDAITNLDAWVKAVINEIVKKVEQHENN